MDPVALAAHGESLWHRLDRHLHLGRHPPLDGHPLYRTLGFHDVGPTTLWWRPTDRAT